MSGLVVKVRSFMDRPLGGMEVEIIYAGIEFIVGISILSHGQAVLDTGPFVWFYWELNYILLGCLWLMSSLLTYVGLLLFAMDNKWCAPLRFLGGFMSAWLWFWVFTHVSTDLDRITTIVAAGSSGFGALWQFRIIISAWRRQVHYWSGRGIASQ
jgi:hypothetical protein